MIQAIKKQFQVQLADWLWIVLVIIGANVFGQILHLVIIKTDETAETSFAMGTFFALVVTLIVLLITAFSQLGTYFNVEISMGFTRLHFFISYYVFCVIFSLAGVLAVMLINLLENRILEIAYPSLPNEIYFMPYLIKYGFPAAVLLPIVAIFCGVLMLRFGRKVFWVIWVIYMLAALGIPTIMDHAETAPESLYGRIGIMCIGLFEKIPVNVWVCLGIVLVIVSFAGSWLLLRKQQVTA